MTIYIDGAFTKLSAASTYSEMSTTTKAGLEAALATLLANQAETDWRPCSRSRGCLPPLVPMTRYPT
jgi:hypothetical protein